MKIKSSDSSCVFLNAINREERENEFISKTETWKESNNESTRNQQEKKKEEKKLRIITTRQSKPNDLRANETKQLARKMRKKQ